MVHPSGARNGNSSPLPVQVRSESGDQLWEEAQSQPLDTPLLAPGPMYQYCSHQPLGSTPSLPLSHSPVLASTWLKMTNTAANPNGIINHQ